MRNLSFSEEEFYHIYNRGVDKRSIFNDLNDVERFLKGLQQFNTKKVIGNIGRGNLKPEEPKLVRIVAYCLNQNHFHLILQQENPGGIEIFMHKLGMGYAKYFNIRNKRTGALFQGKFKAKLVDSNEYLLHLSAYINLNHLAHGRRHSVSTLNRTSWKEYLENTGNELICDTKIILEQFKNKSAYKKFAENSLRSIVERKILLEELEDAGIELVHTA